MKFLSGVLVAISLSLTGIFRGNRLKTAVSEVESIITFLNYCRDSIKYSQLPINYIIETYCSYACNFALIQNCCEHMKSHDFPQAWVNAVKETPLCLNENDLRLLLEFGNKAGTSDVSTQIRIIDYLIIKFESSLTEKKEKEKSCRNLYYMAGITAGIISMILII